MQLDTLRIFRQPYPPLFVEPVPGCIVDDEKDLSSGVALDQSYQKAMERSAVEDFGELIREARVMQRDRAKDMRCFAETIGIYARLHADSGPGLMQGPIEPEARFIRKDDDASAGCGFFLIRGNLVRIQSA